MMTGPLCLSPRFYFIFEKSWPKRGVHRERVNNKRTLWSFPQKEEEEEEVDRLVIVIGHFTNFFSRNPIFVAKVSLVQE